MIEPFKNVLLCIAVTRLVGKKVDCFRNCIPDIGDVLSAVILIQMGINADGYIPFIHQPLQLLQEKFNVITIHAASYALCFNSHSHSICRIKAFRVIPFRSASSLSFAFSSAGALTSILSIIVCPPWCIHLDYTCIVPKCIHFVNTLSAYNLNYL